MTWDELRRAACWSYPMHWWDTSAPREDQQHALAVCTACPVLNACRADALTAPTNGVIQGGIRFHKRPDHANRQRRRLTAAQAPPDTNGDT